MQYKQINLSGDICKHSYNCNRIVKSTYEIISCDEKFLCPFCLHEDIIKAFKTGNRTYGCPECKNNMYKISLIVNMNVREYTKFVYIYMKEFRGWTKFDWEKMKERLCERGLIREFWSEYYRLKDGVVYD